MNTMDDANAPACPEDDDPCAGCSGRRQFLRDAAAGIAAALMVAAGASRARAEEIPVRFGSALARWGSEVAYPVPTADGATVDRANEVILVRWEGRVYAFGTSCPHQRTLLRWEEGRHRFQCPKHHSRYTPDGTFVSGRATRGMDRYSIRRQGAEVMVDTGVLHREDRDRAGWDAAWIPA